MIDSEVQYIHEELERVVLDVIETSRMKFSEEKDNDLYRVDPFCYIDQSFYIKGYIIFGSFLMRKGLK